MHSGERRGALSLTLVVLLTSLLIVLEGLTEEIISGSRWTMDRSAKEARNGVTGIDGRLNNRI